MRGVMSAGSRLDRVAVTLGTVSVLSAGFVVVRGDFQFVRIRGWGVTVAVVLGLLAVVAGWTARTGLVVAAGAGFLVAAAAQVVVWASEGTWLGGDGSTVSLWLGLGVGLLVTGLAPRIWPEGQTEGADR
jgi:hypothetical protein